MDIRLILGISIGIYLAYVLFKRFAVRNAVDTDYRQRMNELLTSKKHQVKGKFD